MNRNIKMRKGLKIVLKRPVSPWYDKYRELRRQGRGNGLRTGAATKKKTFKKRFLPSVHVCGCGWVDHISEVVKSLSGAVGLQCRQALTDARA
jgi:hypothetical protein